MKEWIAITIDGDSQTEPAIRTLIAFAPKTSKRANVHFVHFYDINYKNKKRSRHTQVLGFGKFLIIEIRAKILSYLHLEINFLILSD